MNPPVIGITTANGKRGVHAAVVLLETYVRALAEAGGIPLLIPAGLQAEGWQALCGRLDGILLSGGGDIAPERYAAGADSGLAMEIDPARDEIELGLVRSAAAGGLPFLGICRGCQVVNVALGGTLYLDIPTELPQAARHNYSSETERSLLVHDVTIEPHGRLSQILGGTRLKVNSLHHQAVRDAAPGLQAVAHAPDGVVEALELPDHPFGLAVQWHPECLPDEPSSRALFEAFVQACGQKVRDA